MREFLILFKHEMKMQFPLPFLSKGRKQKPDIIGSLLSLLTTLLVACVFIALLSIVVKNYVKVEIHRVPAPFERGLELLNLLYTTILIAISVACMEKMRRGLTKRRDNELFLRLPVKPQTLLMSKLLAILVWTYIFALVLVVTVNVIFFIALKPSFIFWIYTFLVWVLMPLSAFLIATLLLVPYIKVIDFISERYWLIFVILSCMIIGAFLLYSGLLGILQSLLETGSIKFLFNEAFINTLQGLLVWTYPANCFANIALGKNLFLSLLITVVIAVLAVVILYFVSKRLFYATLYKNESKKLAKKVNKEYVVRKPLASLIHKEFISVFRNRKHLFSYFAIATAMPVMVYCCYTLFESLISNAIGLKVNFSLALLVLLIFSILTNTFCATNITRDGLVALKSKMFPIKASTQLLAKVLFCAIVSSAAVIVSVIVLLFAGLSVWEGCLCGVVALAFSTAQIFIATRMDLNHANVSASSYEIEQINNRTISKVVVLGLILALIFGVLSMALFIFAKMDTISFIASLNLKTWYAYLIPILGGVLYLGFALFYYLHKLEKSFEHMIS